MRIFRVESEKELINLLGTTNGVKREYPLYVGLYSNGAVYRQTEKEALKATTVLEGFHLLEEYKDNEEVRSFITHAMHAIEKEPKKEPIKYIATELRPSYTDFEELRSALLNRSKYRNSYSWRLKVANMTGRQVLAVYLRFKEAGLL